MTDQWDYAELLQPLSEESPCGENLEDSQLLYSFDTFRLFGQSVPLNPRRIGEPSRANRSKRFSKARTCAC